MGKRQETFHHQNKAIKQQLVGLGWGSSLDQNPDRQAGLGPLKSDFPEIKTRFIKDIILLLQGKNHPFLLFPIHFIRRIKPYVTNELGFFNGRLLSKNSWS